MSIEYETRIERVKLPMPRFQAWLGEWVALRDDGWDVTVLVAPDESHVVALACRIAT